MNQAFRIFEVKKSLLPDMVLIPKVWVPSKTNVLKNNSFKESL